MICCLSPGVLRKKWRLCFAAVKKGELTEKEIEAKCRKVLKYKYALGLEKKPHVQLSGLGTRINTPKRVI